MNIILPVLRHQQDDPWKYAPKGTYAIGTLPLDFQGHPFFRLGYSLQYDLSKVGTSTRSAIFGPNLQDHKTLAPYVLTFMGIPLFDISPVLAGLTSLTGLAWLAQRYSEIPKFLKPEDYMVYYISR